MSEDSRREIGEKNLLLVLILNAVLYGILFFFVAINNITPCISDNYRVLPQSITIFLLIHLFLPLLAGIRIAIGIIDINFEGISRALHIPVKTNIIGLLFLASAILSFVFVLTPNPSFRISEPPPFISGFDITDINSGVTKTFPPGWQIDTDDSIFVKAHINGGDENSCKWFVVTGKIIPGKCQTYYTSTTGGVDVLTLTVQSTCGTSGTSSTLCMNSACFRPTLKSTPIP